MNSAPTTATHMLPRSGSPPAEQAPDALVLDRYRLLQRLGAGGFGVVWLALDERLQREVAVKLVARDPEDAAGTGPAAREARAAARLNHPGIVALYELAEDGDDVLLVSELVDGRSLADLERESALSDRDVARIGAALCDALEHAHARGVIHRDVKPANVMVVDRPAAGAGFAKLADFGVAHLASGDSVTRTGDVVGTLAYMAPEQADGARVTPACDVYSLALTLYEAWTGSNPVRGRGPAATARRLGRPLPALADRRRDLPLDLCDAIDDALHTDPERRPSPAALARELRAAEGLLSDEGGLVERKTLERVGLTSATRRLWSLRRGEQAETRDSLALRLAGRAAAAALAGALVVATIATLAPAPPFSELTAGAGAALLVVLAPRIGWIAVAAALCVWLVLPEAGRPGTALVLAAAAAPVPLLLPRAGRLWSLPVLAPLLAAAGLGPAFVALAGLASTAWRRAGLAVAGLLWLALAEVVTGEDLLFGVPDGTRAREAWQGSLTGAAGDALGPLLTSPALAPIAVWATFAAILPLLVRGRSLGLDVVGAGLWAAGLVAAHAGLGNLLASTTVLPDARGAAVGAVLGACGAVAAAHLLGLREPPGGAPEAGA